MGCGCGLPLLPPCFSRPSSCGRRKGPGRNKAGGQELFLEFETANLEHLILTVITDHSVINFRVSHMNFWVIVADDPLLLVAVLVGLALVMVLLLLKPLCH